ncbi:MAG TPA: glycosyltransferase [Gemmataceae bacterium]|jgi:glycosyltransferase involved in cell wall biosynthesis|nr:glycosyltransferase [Gemmataceae bacterium]
MRVGLISCNGQAHNAIGNHLAEKLRFFTERGADVRVFLQSADRLHPGLARHAEVVDRVESHGPAWTYLEDADLVIADFAQDYDLLQFLPLLAGGKPRLLLEYHGVTPPHLWAGPQRACLEQGQARRGLVWCADYALVHSRFTRDDLVRATGFPESRVFQLDFPLDKRFHPGAPAWSLRKRLALGAAGILLFVGRLAVNKCVSVLIEALARLGDMDPPLHAVVLGDRTDVYGNEERRSRDLACRLGVAEHVHFLGTVADDRLADCYRDADVLVMPSVHEGFCVPVLEAMACGLPVIAARATALPETTGDAGLTFAPGDADDLALHIRRVLGKRHGEWSGLPTSSPRRRVAIVSFRFGADIVGGAETSLRKIAHALKSAGREVEVFTTCTRGESDWINELPAGTAWQDDILIHRFPIDSHDRARHLESVRKIVEAEGQVAPEIEKAYLEHSIHSRQLLAKLRERTDDFEAIIAGPYLFGLTCDIAQAFPEKTLLLSCFHEEALARLKVWPQVYGRVGGILYHSPEERDLAQSQLGINHPGGVEIGTIIRSEERGVRSEEFKANKILSSATPPDSRLLTSVSSLLTPHSSLLYLIYCGRYSRQKDVPRLLEFAARYHRERPGRFCFAFMGQGEVAIPPEDWARDLGRVDEATKRALLAGAVALIQLSRQESLSLVALEAWAEGTPVLVSRQCPVLAGQVRRSQGGWAINDYAGFAKVLDDLWENPESGRERGRLGQNYVQQRYASESAFADRLLSAIAGLQVPLREQMRRRGLARAERSRRPEWRERFGQLVEQVLDAGRPFRSQVTVTSLHARTSVKVGTRTLLVPVRVHNSGTHVVCADGPARSVLCCGVAEASARKTQLSGLLLPGKTQTLAAIVNVPAEPGEYPMQLWVDREQGSSTVAATTTATLTVGSTGAGGCTAPFLEVAQEALVEAVGRQCLPDDYLDVTEGRFARWKRWIKNKLLGNFKRGYVDVLSRQQSQVNRQVLVSLQQLTECCATLDHALRGLQERIDRLEERMTHDDSVPVQV